MQEKINNFNALTNYLDQKNMLENDNELFAYIYNDIKDNTELVGNIVNDIPELNKYLPVTNDTSNWLDSLSCNSFVKDFVVSLINSNLSIKDFNRLNYNNFISNYNKDLDNIKTKLEEIKK